MTAFGVHMHATVASLCFGDGVGQTFVHWDGSAIIDGYRRKDGENVDYGEECGVGTGENGR